MNTQTIALFNWNNGVFMIIVFALVCLALIGFLVNFMSSGDKNSNSPKEQ